jgi:hypothetical protein
MMFEFTSTNGKGKDRPSPDEVPTRVSLGNQEYAVSEGCVEAPAKFASDLALHGFRPRQRPSVTVHPRAAEPAPPSRASDPKLPARPATTAKE